ncbi:hypothetical protein, partial [Nocardia sp. NPDC005366]|uniref:hypothetical protein n=1 Tax=Nocardia sp. NPDC005366 TaxID=3156878 RepID=UPI0033B25C14
MGLGATGSDLTDWPDLLKSSRNGKLELLGVDGASLKSLTDSCESLVGDILGLIKAIDDLNWYEFLNWTYAGSVRTTTLDSMNMLFKKFHDKLTVELVQVLRNHQAIVTDMANTFVAANKSYRITDLENEALFQTPAPHDLHNPVFDVSRPISGGDWKDGPPAPHGVSGVNFDARAKNTIAGAVENGSSFALRDFANIAALFDQNDGKIWETAGYVHAMAQVWNRSIDTFESKISPVFTNQHWRGTGADHAVTFLSRYLSAATDLQKALAAMADVIGDTGDFGLFTWSHIPHYSQFEYKDDNSAGEIEKVHDEREDNWNDAAKALTWAQDWWNHGDSTSNNKGYHDGLTQLAAMIPLFTDPNTTASAHTPTGNNTNQNNENGNGNSNNGGSNSNGNGGSNGNSGGTGDGNGKGSGNGNGKGNGGSTGSTSPTGGPN